MNKLATVLLWSALAGLLTVSIYFLINETGKKPSFISGVAIGGGLTATGAYLRKRRGRKNAAPNQ